MQEITSAASTDPDKGIGHGFVSTERIGKIEFTSTDADRVVVGAFVGLVDPVSDELGITYIPSYDEDRRLDFGVVFGPIPELNGKAP